MAGVTASIVNKMLLLYVTDVAERKVVFRRSGSCFNFFNCLFEEVPYESWLLIPSTSVGRHHVSTYSEVSPQPVNPTPKTPATSATNHQSEEPQLLHSPVPLHITLLWKFENASLVRQLKLKSLDQEARNVH